MTHFKRKNKLNPCFHSGIPSLQTIKSHSTKKQIGNSETGAGLCSSPNNKRFRFCKRSPEESGNQSRRTSRDARPLLLIQVPLWYVLRRRMSKPLKLIHVDLSRTWELIFVNIFKGDGRDFRSTFSEVLE
ncbi:hypothetical protein CBL_11388 [Carabus blaptoides fortunei]